MEDPAAKLKQLTDSLQAQQTALLKKKEVVEAATKSVLATEKEVYELRQQIAALEAESEFRKEISVKAKEEVRKKIEQAKRILNSDKAALQTQKDELQAKVTAAEAERNKFLAEKNELLKTNKGAFESKEEVKSAFDEEKRLEESKSFEDLVKDVEVKKDSVTGFLTVESVTKIVDICIILAGRKFRDTVHENRKKLRGNKNLDLKAYLDHAGKEVSQHTELYQEIELQVLKALNCEKAVLDKSIEYYMSVRNLDIIALMNLLGEKLKSYLKSTKEVDVETFKNILKFKTEFIEKEADNIFGEDNRRKVVQTQLASVSGTFQQKEGMSLNMLRNYFEFRLGSAIFERFGVEDEDLREATQKPEIQYDMELAELMMKSEEALYKKIPQLAGQQEAGPGGYY